VLRETNVPAVLVENGFHTNDRERALLSDAVFLEQLAWVYVEALVSFFDEDGERDTQPPKENSGKINENLL